MAKFFIKTDFSEVYKKIEQMEKALQEQAIHDVLEEAGKYMKDRIVANAPHDTGALAKAIDYVVKGEYVQIGVENPTGRVKYYSVYQEFGTHKMSKLVAPLYRNVY